MRPNNELPLIDELITQLTLIKPSPNFEALEKMLKGEIITEQVHSVEFLVDFEVIEFILDKLTGEKLPYFENLRERKINQFKINKKAILLDTEEDRTFLKHYISFYYHMGYDFVPDNIPLLYFQSLVQPKQRISRDTAALVKKTRNRSWVEEGKGIITSWEDFEKFPWEILDLDIEAYYRFFSKNLPDGMKIVVTHSLFEEVLESFLGYEGFSYLLYEQPDLVKEIFNKVGAIVLRYYSNVIALDCVGAIRHCDDLGHNTGTLVSPEILREFVFPWFEKYASLSHQYGKMFLYHCCGNVLNVMDDLIENVKIDGFHSFQDNILPVQQFKRKYGNRIAVLGGVDMDKLCRLSEESLRLYIRSVLDECMPGGKYALGSGNSISNYVPISNYLIMLDAGFHWK